MKTLGDFTDNIPSYLSADSPAKQYDNIIVVKGDWRFYFFDTEGNILSPAEISFDTYLERYVPNRRTNENPR